MALDLSFNEKPPKDFSHTHYNSLNEMDLTYKLVRLLDTLIRYKYSRRLQELATNQDKPIHVTYLYNLYNQPHSEYRDVEETEEDEYVVDDFCYCSNPNWDLPIEITDMDTIKSVYKRRNQLVEALHIVQQQYNIARAEELQEEIDALSKYLDECINRNGNIKMIVDAEKRDYFAVHKGLKDMVERVREIDPELGALCDRHLVYGMTPYWSSDPRK